jgi:drug/metabolite transporter (DMT)-like permease
MDILLYALTVLFWGTSWLAIKFQLGAVAPEASIVYRFAIAAALMLILCATARRPMRFSLKDHGFMALQGVCLFSTNYFFIYLGSQYLTTGLVAVAFSTLVVMNIIGSAVIFRAPIGANVIAGALCGLSGITLVFWPEVSDFDLSRDGTLALVLALVGTGFASLGNMASAWNQRKRGLPVLQTNAYGMVYGVAFITLLTLARGSPFAFDPSPAYVFSLLYLAVFATVIGFWTFLTLVGRIGPWFEEFQWTALGAGGVVLVLLGNVVILTKRNPFNTSPSGRARV